MFACLGVPDALPQRLQSQGLHGWVVGQAAPAGWQTAQHAEQVPSSQPCCWLVGPEHAPPGRAGDIWLRCIADALLAWPVTHDRTMPDQATLTWQESPFAIEHGFMLFVGGPRTVLAQAAPALDALGPAPRGWLVVGDDLAPVFVALVLRQLGLGMAHLAGFAVTESPPDWPAILAGQSAMMVSLAALAASYLGHAGIEPSLPMAPQHDPLHWVTRQDDGRDPENQPGIAVRLAQWLMLVASCMRQVPWEIPNTKSTYP